MNKKKLILYLSILINPQLLPTDLPKAVTYETTNGRFGDNLLSYMHGKWIAYKHNLPLLYRSFLYSGQLVLHEREHRYTPQTTKGCKNIVSLGRNRSVHPDDTSVLYLVPYFPESQWELQNCTGYSGGPWDYIKVDWTDQDFVKILREVIQPCKPLTILKLPADRITVAVHMRRGGNYDPASTVASCPLKFLPDSFFIDQINRLYQLFNQQPLYIHIFTDDHHPTVIRDRFKKYFKSYDIQFVCREQNNSEDNNVLEDFFALQQFDCLIHSESNYSLIASKLGNYMVSIYPDSFYRAGDRVIYDHVNTTINHDHPKMKQLNGSSHP